MLLPCVTPTLSVRLACLTSGWSRSIWLRDSCSLRALLSSSSLTSALSPGIGNRSCIQKCQSYHMGYKDNWYLAREIYCWYCTCSMLLSVHLNSLPAGCSARLWVMIWRMRVETSVGVTPDSCPSPRSVRALFPELPSDWSRDSSNFYNHTSQAQLIKVRLCGQRCGRSTFTFTWIKIVIPQKYKQQNVLTQ